VIATRWTRVPPFERGLTLGDFLVPIRLGERAASWQRHVLMIAAGVALITLSAQVVVPLPFTPVPITGQTFGVLFASALLGFRRSVLTLAIYLLLGTFGAPVFAGWTSGAGKIATFADGHLALGATGGYLVGFLIAGALVGRLAELGWDRRIGSSLAAMLIGNAIVYLLGVPWLIYATGITATIGLEQGFYPFLVGDVVKLAIAAALLPVGWWAVRRRSSDR
jgi:biotin transport system substrate-specific component